MKFLHILNLIVFMPYLSYIRFSPSEMKEKILFAIFFMKKKIVISLVSREFTSGPGHRGSIPGPVIPKSKKMVLDAALLNTPHYKVRIKGKVEQSRE